MSIISGNVLGESGTLLSYDPFKDGSGKALYRLEDNALDESGNYNGAAVNATYGNGQFGRCFVGDGLNRYINTGSVFGLSNGGAATFSVWVKQHTASIAWIISNFNLASLNGIQFFVNADHQVTVGNYVATAKAYRKTSSIVIPLNTWVHVVGIVYENATTDIYINGVLDTAATPAIFGTYTPTQLNSRPYYIGRYADVASNINASIDQLRVFNRVLTQAEVTALYNEI